jgi:hypothetical protein
MISVGKLEKPEAIVAAAVNATEEMKQYSDNRFSKYKIGEHCALGALRCGIITSGDSIGWAPQVTASRETDEKRFWEQISIQRTNGDLFFTGKSGTIEFVDVKNKAWISEKSLADFRSDGWFFIDAWYRPTNEDYARGARKSMPCFIRACDDFKKFAVENFERTKRQKDGHWGYEITVTKIKPEWLMEDFDPIKYTKFMREVWDLYELHT